MMTRRDDPQRAGWSRTHRTTWAAKISTTYGRWKTFQTTGQVVGYPQSVAIGLPIFREGAGFGNRLGMDLGSPMSPGAGRRITMAAGSNMKARGFGGRARSTRSGTIVPSGRLRMFPSSASDGALESDSVFGSIGWLPIGPCDYFYPWWGGYRSRFNTFNVNIYNGRRLWWISANAPGNAVFQPAPLPRSTNRVRGGISTVGANEFGRGRFTARPVSREVFRGGKIMAGNLPVVPTRESLRVSDRAAAPSTIGRGARSEHFFTRNRPAGVRQSFDREAAQVHSNIQRDGHFTPIVGGTAPGVREAASNPAVHVQTGDRPGQMQRGVSGSRQQTTRTPDSAGSGNPERRPRTNAPSPSGPGQRRAGGESSNPRQFPSAGNTGWWKPAWKRGGSGKQLTVAALWRPFIAPAAPRHERTDGWTRRAR